mmetsp:Transcript_5897/g.10866  ORF Transcript_5897/g.10866 Transcript_5897/m.10866 type:complete len:358 (+) Transcript_5897:536-1609(+)
MTTISTTMPTMTSSTRKSGQWQPVSPLLESGWSTSTTFRTTTTTIFGEETVASRQAVVALECPSCPSVILAFFGGVVATLCGILATVCASWAYAQITGGDFGSFWHPSQQPDQLGDHLLHIDEKRLSTAAAVQRAITLVQCTTCKEPMKLDQKYCTACGTGVERGLLQAATAAESPGSQFQTMQQAAPPNPELSQLARSWTSAGRDFQQLPPVASLASNQAMPIIATNPDTSTHLPAHAGIALSADTRLPPAPHLCSAVTDSEGGNVCPTCGFQCNTGIKFCVKCGTKLGFGAPTRIGRASRSLSSRKSEPSLAASGGDTISQSVAHAPRRMRRARLSSRTNSDLPTFGTAPASGVI